MIADGQSGPFRLEIGGVSAVSKIDGRAPDSALQEAAAAGAGEDAGEGGSRVGEGQRRE